MADSKWIPGLTPSMPLEVAARRALAVRLDAVLKQLQSVTDGTHQDVEPVHQLRVASRRCRAVLDLFADVLPEKLYSRLRRQLRRIRRTAGPARDWDVFYLSLADRLAKATSRTASGLHWISGHMAARRALAQAELKESCAKRAGALRDAIGEDSRESLDGRNGSVTTLGQIAGERILQLLDALEEAGRGNLENQERLHRLRIAGKRLRYAMEVLADCFLPPFREDLYPLVEQMQEHLGSINDAHVALTVLEEMQTHAQSFYPQQWRVWRPGVSAFKTSQRQRLQREGKRFLRFWSDWQARDVRGQFVAVMGVTVPQARIP
jgi:CHAD domain-containing protein